MLYSGVGNVIWSVVTVVGILQRKVHELMLMGITVIFMAVDSSGICVSIRGLT